MKISEIKRLGRKYAKGNVKKSAAILVCLMISIIILTAAPYFLSRIISNTYLIIVICTAILTLNIFIYSSFKAGRSAWFLFYNKKKRSQKTLYWFSPSRVFKNSRLYIVLFFKKILLALAFLLPGAAIIISAVILAMNGGVEFNLFVSWIGGGTAILAAGTLFYTVVMQRFFLVPYIRAENPYLKTKEVFRISKKEMNGNLKKTFLMKLSFLPLFISCITVFPVFYVWTYYNQSCALMAQSIKHSASDTIVLSR
ncbi:MAG: DUF975 family protein [Clostridia bacterium]|nr:DUF975 family protein [Clostridia bacterium]